MLVFRQLFDPTSSTYTYLLGCSASKEALLIDPVFEQVRRDAALIGELGLTLKWTLDTHVHADHVTGAWLLKQRLGSGIALSAASGAAGADRLLQDGDRIEFGRRALEVRATPGHTSGCVTYVLDDESMAFTGDCILIRGSGRTDFQQGDPRALYRSVRSRIFALPESCLLYPAHDYRGLTVSSVAEEKKFNPRLGGEVGENDYVGYMKNLDLPHPKKIDEAVPANLRCGQPGNGASAPAEPGLGAAALHLRRRLGSRAALARGEPRQGARRRRARAGRVHRPAGPHPRRDARAAGRAGRAREGAAEGQARSSPSAAPAAAPRMRRRSCRRPASPTSPTSPAACCAGAPKAAPSRAARLRDRRPEKVPSSLTVAPEARSGEISRSTNSRLDR